MLKIRFVFVMLGIACFFIVINNSHASTIKAASCNLADVNAAINSAVSGDTVSIPVGSCTWTSGITIPDAKKIIIQGAGYSNTVINHGSITVFTIGSGGGNITGMRITGIGFTRTATAYDASVIARGTGWRIDNNRFTNSTGSSQMSIEANGTNVEVHPAGVIDNNDFVEGRIVVEGMGTFAKNSALWAAASVQGTVDTVFIEDNTFYKTVEGGGNVIDSGRAGHYVARYNTITGTTEFMVHSLQADTERAPRGWEMYGNSLTTSSAVFCAMWLRGGTGIISHNRFAGSYTNKIYFDNRRSTESFGLSESCNGSSYWDGNEDATGWPCRDQIGRGQDAFAWSSNNVLSSPKQVWQPAYLVMNRGADGSLISPNVASGSSSHIKANRDYYSEVSSFTGASGTGCGTLAKRPATCTTGVAYWATDQSCTSLTGMVGKNPTMPISGALYKCTATNTWTLYYKPYTYPHPLRTGSKTLDAPALRKASN